jgi:LuxR family maltose regulon positive regulatory protein
MPPPVLINVKFFVPKPRSILTERTQLLTRFDSGLEKGLTLISAPAGFGKSTLLSMWIAGRTASGVLAWLSVDGSDNHPARFWTYILAAIRTGLGSSALQNFVELEEALEHLLELSQSDPPPSVPTLLDELINAISSYGGTILLVLDDYHAINQMLIHEQMTYLLDHQPPNLRLVIATRADPALPIARLRAKGQLSEFRAADLHFTQLETAKFFQTTLGVELRTEDIEAILESTEGWIAGLQMAALALQTQVSNVYDKNTIQEKAHQFIQSFSGKNIYVMDYLADEVFNGQPESIQTFLLKTSVLQRFCCELCDDLLSSDEGDGYSSETVLAHLEKTNLFLIPLDQERQWFRYHHLFADILRVRLNQAWPNLKYGLHQRASKWYARNGFVEDAIQHAIAAKDWEQAASLIEREIQTFLERGQLSKVLEWMNLLPKEIADKRIQLLFQQAYVMGLAHRMKEFVPLLAAEEKALAALEQERQTAIEEMNRLRCNLVFHQAYYAISKNEPEIALRLAEEGLSILPPGCPWEESWLWWMRAYSNRSLNRLDRAADYFEQAFLTAEKHDNLWTDMVCLTDLAMVQHLLGNLKTACDTYFRALDLGKVRGAEGHSYLNRVEGWLSLLLIERNQIEEASEHSQAGLALSQLWPSTNTRSVNLIVLAQIDQVKGNLDSAGRWLEQAEIERQKSPLMPVNNSLLDSNLVRYWIASGNLSKSSQWAQSQGQSWRSQEPGLILSETQEAKWITVARVLIALGRTGEVSHLDEAIELLNRIEQSGRECGRVNTLVEVLVLKAVALQLRATHGKSNPPADSAALRTVEEALSYAEPGGYMRLLINEGEVMLSLLNALHRRQLHRSSSGKTYLGALIAALTPSVGIQPQKPADQLIEPLTERESEVLRLMANGLSNKEMAERLVLSEGTVKTHVHNIMGKLNAQSRTQAVARARDLTLI